MSGGQLKDHSADDAPLRGMFEDGLTGPTREWPAPITLPPAFRYPDIAQGRTAFSWFGYWFVSFDIKDTVGWCSHLYEYTPEGWRSVTYVSDLSMHAASRRAYYLARDLLITGQRSDAEALSPELKALADYYRSTGEHLIRDDYERAQG